MTTRKKNIPPTAPLISEASQWREVPRFSDTDAVTVPGLRSVFYDNISYHGKISRVFAFVGFPKQLLAGNGTVPGVVLVHGGRGTAFYNWVQMWNERGYAAIAMDCCGCLPDITKDHFNGTWERDPNGGPGGWGDHEKPGLPWRERWICHAVAAVIKGHSLLRSLPGIDSNCIGVTGPSWGGVLTCLAAGLDPRFAWAAPVYGCGGSGFRKLAPFDSARYLKQRGRPMLFLNGTNDFAFHLNFWNNFIDGCGCETGRCVRIEMVHGHGEVSENPLEILDFAESVRTGRELFPSIDRPREKNTVTVVTFRTGRRLQRAELCYTRATGYWPDRKWNSLPAELSAGKASANLPPRVTAWFFNFYDDHGLLYSSPMAQS